MTSRIQQLAIAAAAAVALVAAGCGDSEEPQGEKLPPAVSQQLLQQLDSVSDRVAAGVSGACDDIYASAADDGNIEPIDAALASVPTSVDPEIRSALEQSVERLKQLVDEECAQINADEQDTATEETTPTETETTETETTPTETETTPTETETTPTTTETTPADEPPGNGPDGTGPPGQGGGGAEAPGSGDE